MNTSLASPILYTTPGGASIITLSAYFAEILSERYGVPDRRGDEAIAADWAEKCEAYYELLAAQKAELSEYGYLKSWTIGDEQ